MALIAICCHDTIDNDRSKYTSATLLSIFNTVDFTKHRLIVIDNNSCPVTKTILAAFIKPVINYSVITLPENIGTAAGINFAIKERLPNEVVIKMDNDVVVHQSGWVDELEQVLLERPDIGILGLKRDDVTGEFTEEGKFLFGDDIMGTCTAFNPALLDKVGYMTQPSPHYGFDDVIFSARSLAAGFKNAFLPHIKITHLDDGKNPYCDWKKKEAGVYLQEVGHMCEMIKSGQLNYYYDGGIA